MSRPLDLDLIEDAAAVAARRGDASLCHHVRDLVAGVRALREQVAEGQRDLGRAMIRARRLEDAIRQLGTTVEAFGVESTTWQADGVAYSADGLAIPDDCDRCEVTIDSDVYEAVTDTLALLDGGAA